MEISDIEFAGEWATQKQVEYHKPDTFDMLHAKTFPEYVTHSIEIKKRNQ